MNNYELTKRRAAAQFLEFSQEQIIKRWGLKADAEALCLTFVGKNYAVSRSSGEIICLDNGQSASFNEAMTIYDLLCFDSDSAVLSGNMTSLNGLSRAQSAWMSESHVFFREESKLVDIHPDIAVRNLKRMNAREISGADIAFEIAVFKEIKTVFKFWHSDDEFPASIQTYWDYNLTDFMHYETICYAGHYIIGKVTEGMEN